MSFGIPVDSQGVAVPIYLENRSTGKKLLGPLSRTDVAGAMVVFGSSEGKFQEEFFPLRFNNENEFAYEGKEWVLLQGESRGKGDTFFLGIPDQYFSGNVGHKSISVEVVGSSMLTGSLGYTGGLDLHLQEKESVSIAPGFLNVCERFFPTLLPPNFVESFVLDKWQSEEPDLILKVALRIDPDAKLPQSFGKHWQPKNWTDAVVENLFPPNLHPSFYSITSGCFYSRDKRISHWFGEPQNIDAKDFRLQAAKKIASMGTSSHGAWIFWLKMHGIQDSDKTFPSFPLSGDANFSIRHALLGYLVSRQSSREKGIRKKEVLQRLNKSLFFARMPMDLALETLGDAAKVLLRFQDYRRGLGLRRTGIDGSGPGAFHLGFEKAVQQLYSKGADSLRQLELAFDDAYGFPPWGMAGQEMQDVLESYLAEES